MREKKAIFISLRVDASPGELFGEGGERENMTQDRKSRVTPFSSSSSSSSSSSFFTYSLAKHGGKEEVIGSPPISN